jgi:hypothetical protein
VVNSDRYDWLNCSSTPSRFKAGLTCSTTACALILKEAQRFLIIENIYFSVVARFSP